MTIAATALLCACSHAANTTLPATLAPRAPDAPQRAPQAVTFPLRAAAGTVRYARSAASAAHCGTVVTQAFGALTYAVRGKHFDHATIDATGCDVGIFIGANDGENDGGAVVDHTTVSNAGFAGILVTDGVDSVSIDHTSIGAIGGDPSGVSAALAIDGATNVRVAHTDVATYQTYGFLAEAGASFSFDHVSATGPGAVTTGAQAGFAVAGAIQLGNGHPKSSANLGSGTGPAFLVPSGGGNARSWGYIYCAVTDANGKPLTSVGDHPKSSDNTNDVALAATCPGSPVPTPTPIPTPSPTPSPSGPRAYVSNDVTATIGVYDVNHFGNLLTTIDDPSLTSRNAMTLADGKLYVTNPDRLVPANNTVTVYDTATNALVRTISGNLLNTSYGIAIGGGKLYVSDIVGNRLSVFDVTNDYAPLPPISDPSIHGPVGAAYGDGKLYVAEAGNNPDGSLANDVSVFDAASGAFLTTIPSPNPLEGLWAVAYANGLLYVSNQYTSEIYVFDTRNGNALLRTITDQTLRGPIGMAIAGGRLYVINYNFNNVTVYDVNHGYNYVQVFGALFPGAIAVQ